MKPIQKWAHAQRLIEAAYRKVDSMESWYFSPFEKKSLGSELDRMAKVINRLIAYSHNQLTRNYEKRN